MEKTHYSSEVSFDSEVNLNNVFKCHIATRSGAFTRFLLIVHETELRIATLGSEKVKSTVSLSSIHIKEQTLVAR